LLVTAQGWVRYLLKNPYRDGTTHAMLDRVDFITRMAALVPKPRDPTIVSNREIEKAMNKLIHPPGKSLGFRTPYEVFFNTRTSLTVALQS
jgi:hypothetical protein